MTRLLFLCLAFASFCHAARLGVYDEGRHRNVHKGIHKVKHGKVVEKELDLEDAGHADFDPEFAASEHEDDLDVSDLGYDYSEVEDDDDHSLPDDAELRLRQVCGICGVGRVGGGTSCRPAGV
jgi:hypothetical protein